MLEYRVYPWSTSYFRQSHGQGRAARPIAGCHCWLAQQCSVTISPCTVSCRENESSKLKRYEALFDSERASGHLGVDTAGLGQQGHPTPLSRSVLRFRHVIRSVCHTWPRGASPVQL